MEFTNEIFFNKNLIENETIILTYTGKLYREHSSEITIVYGFGDNWEYTSESRMSETENGFEVTIKLKSYNTFNFCFKNNYEIWDNNSGFNYIAPISEKTTIIENQSNENISITETSNNIEIEKTQNDIETEINVEANANPETSEFNSKDEIENIFSSLLDSILDIKPCENNESINLENGFGLQSIDEIKEEELSRYNELFKQFSEETLSTNDEILEEGKISAYELENLFNSIVENSNIENSETTQTNEEELDKLMNNILNSIVDSEKNELEFATPIENTSNDEQFTEINAQNIQKENNDINTTSNNLPAVINENNTIFEKFLETSYNLFQRLGTACKKLGSLVKLKAQEYGIIKK